jgi:hypothetical protein
MHVADWPTGMTLRPQGAEHTAGQKQQPVQCAVTSQPLEWGSWLHDHATDRNLCPEAYEG